MTNKKNAKLIWIQGVFLLLFLIVLDQVVKAFLFSHNILSGNIKNFGILLFNNYNFAFSVPLPKSLMFLFYFILACALGMYFKKKYNISSRLNQVGMIAIIAGAVSNICERIFLGYVRDWLYIFTGIFNLADLYIIFGVIILLLFSSKQKSTNFDI